jgi:nucleoside phosphorylase
LIIIFYAFAREIGPFKRRLKNRRPLEHRELRGFRANLGETELAAVATGIGPTRARAAARRAFELYPEAELAIGTGVAGALDSALGPGDLVLAERVIVHQNASVDAEDMVAIEGQHLDELAQILRSAGVRFSSGTLLTSHRVLAGSAEKHSAKERTGAIAVDMETVSIAKEARSREVPFVCLRSIIDAVDDEVAGANLADENGEVRALAAASYLVRNPGELLKLPRMIRDLGRATRSLADALEVILTRGQKKPALS